MEFISQTTLRGGYNFFIDDVAYFVPNGITTWFNFEQTTYGGDFTGTPVQASGASSYVCNKDLTKCLYLRHKYDNWYSLVSNDSSILENGVYHWGSYQEDTTSCCFVAGTQITIPSNTSSNTTATKNIEDFMKGDVLISYNPEAKEFYESICQGLIVKENTTDIAEVTFANGEKLVMNAYHPILTTEGFKSLTGYEGYNILGAGDVAIAFDSKSSSITQDALQSNEIIDIYRYESEPITTYNLMVSDIDEYPDDDTNDTYIANGIVVHNAGCQN